MGNYIFRRVLLALPTLLIVSLCTFGLSKCAPGDPLMTLHPEILTLNTNELGQIEQYKRLATNYGFDKPSFYFTLTTQAFPDTFHRILLPERKTWLAALAAQNGHWPNVQDWADQLLRTSRMAESLPDSTGKLAFRLALNDLRRESRLGNLPALMDSVQQKWQIFSKNLPENVAKNDFLVPLQQAQQNLQTQSSALNNWIPNFQWHGLDNQYHRWATGFLSGNLGTSLHTRTPVWGEIRARLGITLAVNGFAFFFAYLLAIPLGLWVSQRAGKPADVWVKRILAAIYAMPTFWLGSLLIIVFATKGQGWQLFGGIGPNNPEDSNLPLLAWILKNGSRLVLPVFVLALHLFAILTLYMRSGVLDVIKQDFIRTARAKGLSEGQVFRHHAFRNALFPLIMVFGALFPAVFAGSLIVEYLFNIPGIGSQTHDAFMNRDYPVLFAILMYSAFLTILGGLVADVLYAVADPRVRFSRR